MTTSPRRLVSLPEAAEILAVCPKTVRRYIAAGELDAVRASAGAPSGSESSRSTG